MSTKLFQVLHQEKDLALGHLDGYERMGVYLSRDYLDRLSEIRRALRVRLEVNPLSESPDALKNLLGVIDRLLAITTPSDHAFAEAVKEFETLSRELEKFRDGDNDPDKA